MIKKDFPWWLFAFSIMIVLTVPVLIQDGMFMDGVLYVSVAKNMANGIGTFWYPQFSKLNIAGLSSFHEQPPLGFWIESLFFRAFGDSMYVERFYTFFCLCLAAFLIVLIWREITHNNDRSLGWLPMILWIITPVCFWSYSNNMHENTMTIFILLSAWCYLKYINQNNFIFLVLAGVNIFLATFTKGIPGFFPILSPFLLRICTKKTSLKKMLIESSVLLLIPLIIYFVLFMIPESRISLSNYIFKRMLHRISDVPTVTSRFYIFSRLLQELLVPAGVSFICFYPFRKFLSAPVPKKQIQLSLFFILLGIAGSIPLVITRVQKGFYLVPSLPFFALGLALIISPYIKNAIDRFSNSSQKRFLSYLSLALFIGVVIYSMSKIGKTSRDKNLLSDVSLIANAVPEKTVISIPAEMWDDWSLQCYLVRYHNISVDDTKEDTYYLLRKNLLDKVPPGYALVNLNTSEYNLYRKK